MVKINCSYLCIILTDRVVWNIFSSYKKFLLKTRKVLNCCDGQVVVCGRIYPFKKRRVS